MPQVTQQVFDYANLEERIEFMKELLGGGEGPYGERKASFEGLATEYCNCVLGLFDRCAVLPFLESNQPEIQEIIDAIKSEKLDGCAPKDLKEIVELQGLPIAEGFPYQIYYTLFNGHLYACGWAEYEKPDLEFLTWCYNAFLLARLSNTVRENGEIVDKRRNYSDSLALSHSLSVGLMIYALTRDRQASILGFTHDVGEDFDSVRKGYKKVKKGIRKRIRAGQTIETAVEETQSSIFYKKFVVAKQRVMGAASSAIFGQEEKWYVENLERLTKHPEDSLLSYYGEYLTRLFGDIWAVVVKLADMLHNVATEFDFEAEDGNGSLAPDEVRNRLVKRLTTYCKAQMMIDRVKTMFNHSPDMFSKIQATGQGRFLQAAYDLHAGLIHTVGEDMDKLIEYVERRYEPTKDRVNVREIQQEALNILLEGKTAQYLEGKGGVEGLYMRASKINTPYDFDEDAGVRDFFKDLYVLKGIFTIYRGREPVFDESRGIGWTQMPENLTAVFGEYSFPR